MYTIERYTDNFRVAKNDGTLARFPCGAPGSDTAILAKQLAEEFVAFLKAKDSASPASVTQESDFAKGYALGRDSALQYLLGVARSDPVWRALFGEMLVTTAALVTKACEQFKKDSTKGDHATPSE